MKQGWRPASRMQVDATAARRRVEALRASGFTLRELAERFGCSTYTIHGLSHGAKTISRDLNDRITRRR